MRLVSMEYTQNTKYIVLHICFENKSEIINNRKGVKNNMLLNNVYIYRSRCYYDLVSHREFGVLPENFSTVLEKSIVLFVVFLLVRRF